MPALLAMNESNNSYIIDFRYDHKHKHKTQHILQITLLSLVGNPDQFAKIQKDLKKKKDIWKGRIPSPGPVFQDYIHIKMSGFKPVELFGGAITADFPTAFGDVR